MSWQSFLKGVREAFQGNCGEISSKRVVTLISFVLLCVAFIANLFFGLTISEFIFKNFVYIVLAGLGLATAEPIAAYFGAAAKPDNKEDDDDGK